METITLTHIIHSFCRTQGFSETFETILNFLITNKGFNTILLMGNIALYTSNFLSERSIKMLPDKSSGIAFVIYMLPIFNILFLISNLTMLDWYGIGEKCYLFALRVKNFYLRIVYILNWLSRPFRKLRKEQETVLAMVDDESELVLYGEVNTVISDSLEDAVSQLEPIIEPTE